jgi:hypothetical protein
VVEEKVRGRLTCRKVRGMEIVVKAKGSGAD